jgi:GTPase Era involved in 16S rRNA processing
MAYDAKKQKALESALCSTANLVGDLKNTPNEEGVIVGLNLLADAELCKNEADAIKEGVFKTVVMGTFNNGKSTVINALIGKKLLPEAATPATAILSYIRYGNDDNQVFVHYNDNSIKEMSFNDFSREFKFTVEDAKECKDTGRVARFMDVNYSVIYISKELMENGVQIIDSPGLEDKATATELALQAARSANAIIYLGSAPSGGFNSNDKEYFGKYFEKKHLNNVFFVINKKDLLSEDALDEVQKFIETQLEDVFKDQNGHFDRSLYQKRVFFVSAKNALDAKTSTPLDSEKLRRSDFVEFEKELENFLTTDERVKATYNTCFEKLHKVYESAKQTTQMNLAVKEKNKDEVRADVEKAEAYLQTSEGHLTGLSKSFEVAKIKTQSVLFNELIKGVNSIEDSWEANSDTISSQVDFGVFEMLGIIWNRIKILKTKAERDTAIYEKIKPLAEAVSNHIKNELETHISNLQDVTEPIVEDLKREIKDTERKLNLEFNKIYEMFSVDSELSVEQKRPNPIQLIISTIQGDVSVVSGLLAGNSMGWLEYLKTYIFQGIMQAIIFLALGPVGWIAFIIIEIWQLIRGAGKLKERLLNEMKGKLFATLREKVQEKQSEFFAKISTEFDKSYKEISAPTLMKIKDERKKLDTVKERLDSATFDFEAEVRRTTYICEKIYTHAKEAYSVVFGENLTEEKFGKL